MDKKVDLFHSSKIDTSIFNGCAVRVHNNPLLENCVVHGKLSSDLTYMLQYDPSLIENINRRIPDFSFSDEKALFGTRHISLAMLHNVIRDYDELSNSLNNIVSKNNNTVVSNADGYSNSKD